MNKIIKLKPKTDTGKALKGAIIESTETEVKDVASRMLKSLTNSFFICEKLQKGINNSTLNLLEKEGTTKIIRELQYECENLVGMSQKITNLAPIKLPKTT